MTAAQASDEAELPPSASFRDPAGRLYVFQDCVLRTINDSVGAADLEAFLGSALAAKSFEDKSIVETTVLTESNRKSMLERLRGHAMLASQDPLLLLEHARVSFPSYPYEWPAEMLFEAGQLTLELASKTAETGFGLKDATPYNVLFRGPNAVFIDLLSFERRDPRDPTWLPYGQFVRTFIMPLLVYRHFGLPPNQLLLTHRDGLEPEEVSRMTRGLKRFARPFFGLVTLPSWLARKQNPDDVSLFEKRLDDNTEKAKFILSSILNGLGRDLERVRPPAGRDSTWSSYMQGNCNYDDRRFEEKRSFVETSLKELGSRKVLDVGCNTGFFSALAARSGAQVVGLDYDPVVVGDVFRQAKKEKLDILPLVVDLTRPTPGVGWKNREWPSFLDRSKGRFDLVMMLAVIHHMLVTERIPLSEIVDLAHQLTTDAIIIEFVGPEDSMFRRLLRGRAHLFSDLNEQVFESELARGFDVARKERLSDSHRWLYLLRKKRPRA